MLGDMALKALFTALLPLYKEETMDKNQVIEILSSKGFFAHDTNGILYVDLDDIGTSSINKVRNMLTELGYHNSWGVKMVKTGSLAVNNSIDNREADRMQDLDYSEPEESAKESALSDDHAYGMISDSENEAEDVEKASSNYYQNEEPKSEYDDKNTAESHTDEEADDMMFDENSPFEQVSLFDMMS